MAFIFVPNADGSFTEGDKQQNPDTGVEYIYDSGAWRALGPKIEDEFDTLDKRYATQDYVDDAIEAIPDQDLSGHLPTNGGTLTGALTINQSPLLFKKNDEVTKQFKISPNVSDGFTNIYSFNNGGMRFRVSSDNTEGSYKTVLAAFYNDHTVGGATQPVETQLNWLRTPTNSHHAANKQYVDDEISKVNNQAACFWERVNKNAESLDVGEFYISSSNNHIYLHPKAIGNIDLNMNNSVDKITGIKHMVSVHKYNATIAYSIVCNEISFNNGSNKYIRLSASEVLCDDFTSEDQQLRINIPGFTF